MLEQQEIRALETRARSIRRHIIEMMGWNRAGHLGGSCSIAEIVAVLYFHKMRLNPLDPRDPRRDRFLLSKGHAALAQYAALAEVGYFPKEEMNRAKTLGSMLQGHPDMRKTPGVEANTGSLGQGLSIACGMALGLRLDNLPCKVYVVLGDGEVAEGQIWEAAMAASRYKVDNLVAILDCNRYQATGSIEERFNTSPQDVKWRAFGWQVVEVDGHDVCQIADALDRADSVRGKPTIIIAHTTKGKGLPFAEDSADFHNAPLSREQFEQALQLLSQ